MYVYVGMYVFIYVRFILFCTLHFKCLCTVFMYVCIYQDVHTYIKVAYIHTYIQYIPPSRTGQGCVVDLSFSGRIGPCSIHSFEDKADVMVNIVGDVRTVLRKSGCVCIHVQIINLGMNVCMYVCMYVCSIYESMYICMYVCIYVCMYESDV